ncbi:helix-turn-helix domain-containing protein [Brevibacillus centrosporus]|uniref:helix-turn-helix domain-containing protein n=1 Tax=Brevibacillus centrosporus TaxID=54910 RepID=UPI001143B8E1|nr:helix-turn-helix domain-containing protein [Brevibacillus centrosporus]MEC2127853.1 helix-turn-helix domain-containing protein [Brevibacillus centrosporus]GED32093.1 hypothetical protein BCE02nite_32340 [Brevibacillus centrosporus]
MMFKQQDVINVDRSEEIYISATEAAALLGVSVQRVYSLVKKNAITFVRYGRKILIRKDDLVARQDLSLPEGVIEVKREYFPDMERMKKALEVLLRS